MAGASGGPLGFFVSDVSTARRRICATIGGLTADLQVLGHILDTGTDSGVDLAPERAGSACSNLFLCSSLSEQTNKQLLYSVHDTHVEPSAV